MDKESLRNITAKWFLIIFLLLYVRQVKVFDYKTTFPPIQIFNDQNYLHVKSSVANSDTKSKFSNYIHIVKIKRI